MEAPADNSERRWGLGLAVTSFSGAAMIALLGLMLPVVRYPIPLLLACGVGFFIGVAMMIRGRPARALQPDWTIAHALKYLVNNAEIVADTERAYQDALYKIEEQIGFGTLTAFGRQALTPGYDPHDFDRGLTIIPPEYWKSYRLHGILARTGETDHTQTERRQPLFDEQLLYADVRLDRAQVQRIWKQKSWWRRFRKREWSDDRLWGADTTPHEVQVVATKTGFDGRLIKPGERFTTMLALGKTLPKWQQLAEEYDGEREAEACSDRSKREEQLAEHQRTRNELGHRADSVPGRVQMPSAKETEWDVAAHIVKSDDDAVALAVLGITNRGSADDFQAQVVSRDDGNGPCPIPPVTLKWRNWDGPSRRIAPGMTEYLEIAKLYRNTGAEFREPNGKLRRGIATVAVNWNAPGYLGVFSYWEAEDFRSRVWTIEVAVSGAGGVAPKRLRIRLHLFGKIEDDPSGKLAIVGSALQYPTIRVSLPDVTPLPVEAAQLTPTLSESSTAVRPST